MKKVILSVFAILVFGVANAQVKFGVKGGVNFATIMGATDSTMKVGFHVGGLAEITLMENFAIQPELLFSLQGGKQKSDFFGTSFESTSSLYYVNIPVMLKYYVITEKLALEAGPQIGFLASVNNETKSDSETTTSTDKEGYNTIDFGINAGASYNFTENVFAGLRYDIGLNNINKDSSEDGNRKNAVLQLSVGYKF